MFRDASQHPFSRARVSGVWRAQGRHGRMGHAPISDRDEFGFSEVVSPTGQVGRPIVNHG